MSAPVSPLLVGYLTCTIARDSTRTYAWRGGPQLLVSRSLFAGIREDEWDGHCPPEIGERATLATFPVRVVGYDQACDWYVLMREDADG